MNERHVLLIGGGLAGLSAGCYARASGFRTTIVEHNLALGGVCTAWPRGPYLIDGCIHWLTGGPFAQLYGELGITPAVPLRTLKTWVVYRDAASGDELRVTDDLDALGRELCALAPDDGAEIQRLIDGARRFAELAPGGGLHEHPPTVAERLRELWSMRGALGALVHFRQPVQVWASERLRSERLRRLFGRLAPPDASALVLLMVLGYLERGYLSRPAGGTRAFRDALIATYERLGGETRLHATVDEVLVEGGRARGVRLADGTLIEADAVISTASLPETTLRLLGGRYGAEETRQRLSHWKLFDPIVLASFGVAAPLTSAPQTLLVDGVQPFDVGGRSCDHLYVRVCNDDPSFAPDGHSVVQAMLATDYTWWATRGLCYQQEKDALGERILDHLELALPGISADVRLVDVATPLTFWTSARSWRGAYEGWLPTSEALFAPPFKTLPGLHEFYLAGQWVEPGGGVPMALQSGRQAVQLLCADAGEDFTPDPAAVAALRPAR